MAKFTITIEHDGGNVIGLAPIRDIIANGLGCITPAITQDITPGAGVGFTLTFDADPESIETTIDQYFKDEEDLVAAHYDDETDGTGRLGQD